MASPGHRGMDGGGSMYIITALDKAAGPAII